MIDIGGIVDSAAVPAHSGQREDDGHHDGHELGGKPCRPLRAPVADLDLAAACEALRTRTDARTYLPAEYDAVVEALDRT